MQPHPHLNSALIDHETRGITVFPMDEKLAALWEVSAAGRSELREHAPLVRRAVGLGRSALVPLSLLAALCGPDKEVRGGGGGAGGGGAGEGEGQAPGEG